MPTYQPPFRDNLDENLYRIDRSLRNRNPRDIHGIVIYRINSDTDVLLVQDQQEINTSLIEEFYLGNNTDDREDDLYLGFGWLGEDDMRIFLDDDRYIVYADSRVIIYPDGKYIRYPLGELIGGRVIIYEGNKYIVYADNRYIEYPAPYRGGIGGYIEYADKRAIKYADGRTIIYPTPGERDPIYNKLILYSDNKVIRYNDGTIIGYAN